MSGYKFAVSVVAMSVALAAAVPAQAVETVFATFALINTKTNVEFVNTGNSAGRLTDGKFFTTTNPRDKVMGAVNVKFSFLQTPLAAYVTDVMSAFTLDGTITKNTPATPLSAAGGSNFVQTGFGGTMTFLSTSAITVTGPSFITHTYAAGSNLLTATFASSQITGQIKGASGGANGSTSGGDIVTFTSDFLNFTPTIQRDFSLALSSVFAKFGEHAGANKALTTFRANMSGQFGSDPAPVINGLTLVPEPATWAMMIAGFSLVGVAARRRKFAGSVTA